MADNTYIRWGTRYTMHIMKLLFDVTIRGLCFHCEYILNSVQRLLFLHIFLRSFVILIMFLNIIYFNVIIS
jgi:hypothetical protein